MEKIMDFLRSLDSPIISLGLSFKSIYIVENLFNFPFTKAFNE
jgi:hypothetical protein